MTAYKVVTGYEKDFYGYDTNTEKAKYFFNKKDAKDFQKEGGMWEQSGRKGYWYTLEEIEIN